MKRHFFSTPVAATFLLSTLACSKNSEPAPTGAIGSYQLDNATVICQATASVTTATSGGISIDYLTIDLFTNPQPATGPQLLHLYFVKPNVQNNNTYTLSDITFMPTSSSLPYAFSVDGASLTTTSNGGFSGTFSGKIFKPGGIAPGPYTTITSGTFTNVRP
jgi:hypothetical protein